MAASELAEEILRATIEYLKEEGYIDDSCGLIKAGSLDERMEAIDPPSGGLHTIDAINCVLDRKRTLALMGEIERALAPGEVVVEAGVGTGILAALAAALGGEVYGIEINGSTLGLAREISGILAKIGLFDERRLHLIQADASLWTPPGRVDVVISENIYTGMFYEMQIPIVNHLLDFMSPSGRMIPEGMESWVIAAEAPKPEGIAHGELFSLSSGGRPKELSGPYRYDRLDFSRRNAPSCLADLEMQVIRSGLFNSLLIYSPVAVSRENVLQREDTIFMGDDILISLEPPLTVRQGGRIGLKIAYERGCKPEQARFSAGVLA